MKRENLYSLYNAWLPTAIPLRREAACSDLGFKTFTLVSAQGHCGSKKSKKEGVVKIQGTGEVGLNQ